MCHMPCVYYMFFFRYLVYTATSHSFYINVLFRKIIFSSNCTTERVLLI